MTHCSLTLWPAFVGVICAFGPDASSIVHDSVWWGALFAMTCSGLPGTSATKPSHHIEAATIGQARLICENHQLAKSCSPEAPQSGPAASTTPRQTIGLLEWFCFLACLGLYLTFSVLFAYALQDSFVFSFGGSTLPAAAWYWLSAAPALLAIMLSEIWQNRVELYEKGERDNSIELAGNDCKTNTAISSALLSTASVSALPATTLTLEPASVLAVPYHKADAPTAIRVWSRILMHQWYGRSYRLLIKPHSMSYYFLLVRLIVGIARIAVFAFGSISMGDIIFMPVPQDFTLFVLLIFTTAIPRIVFPGLWATRTQGADLVVFVEPT